MKMSKEDSLGEHLKSSERKERKKEILARASDVVNKNKGVDSPKRSSEEIQELIEIHRNQLHNENMQPPPPPTFVDEFGKPIFEDQSDISLNVGMPRRFKEERAEPVKPVKPAYHQSAPPTTREMYGMVNSQEVRNIPPPQQTMQQQYNSNKEFSHTTDLMFHDLNTEEYREYIYNNGGVLRVLQPWKLGISKSGNHRVATRDGFSYIIVPNWIAIRIKKKEGAPSFTF
jgi:hypothetical protein